MSRITLLSLEILTLVASPNKLFSRSLPADESYCSHPWVYTVPLTVQVVSGIKIPFDVIKDGRHFPIHVKLHSFMLQKKKRLMADIYAFLPLYPKSERRQDSDFSSADAFTVEDPPLPPESAWHPPGY